jgi:hypothetical protein
MHQVPKIFILLRNSTCFGHLLCPPSGVINCTRGSWYVSCRLCGRCLGESGWNWSSNLTARQRPHKLYETCQSPRVQLITPDGGHRRCPKHVEFRDKIKILDTWMHLVGYLYEDYHDARSIEHEEAGRVWRRYRSESRKFCRWQMDQMISGSCLTGVFDVTRVGAVFFVIRMFVSEDW